jgi:hypothetical protein
MHHPFLLALLFSLVVFCQGHAEPVSLWSTSANPVTITTPDTNSVELGVKFSSGVSGTVSAIRFYKGPLNTGAHTVSLWSSSGPRLAQATATNETAGGWQTVPLSPPIVIKAGTTYVASYHAPNGRYADDQNYFPYKSRVLSAPVNAGVYAYGASSAFPNKTWDDSNYWVDVVFSPVVPRPPIAGNVSFTGAENTVLSIPASTLLAADSDPNGLPLSVTGVSSPSHGAATYNPANRTVSFTPTANYVGAAGFTYTVTDTGGASASGKVSLTITATDPPPPPPSGSVFNLWWGGGWGALDQTQAILSWAQSNTPASTGVKILTAVHTPDRNAPGLVAAGYQVMEGLGGYAAQWAQNYSGSNGCAGLGSLAEIEGDIDAIYANGARWVFVDEPCPAPGETSVTSSKSIAYNTAGFNIIYNYIHRKYPDMKFGLTFGDNGGAPTHLLMLKAGLHEDFASEEEYYANGVRPNVSPFGNLKQQYPNVLTMGLFYSSWTLCQNDGAYIVPGGFFDIIAGWDINNSGLGIGPAFDGDWLKNMVTFASTGQKPFCNLPFTNVQPTDNNVRSKDFQVQFNDYMLVPNYDPSTIQQCEWQVMSGANAINGPSDPTVVVTQPWTSRPCFNSSYSVTITVGAGKMCRDEDTSSAARKLTCMVWSRARNQNGVIGDTYYTSYWIQY